MSGNLPPGCTDADIDRAAPENEPFYCSVFASTGMHCARFDKSQCGYCQLEDYMASRGEPREE